MTKPARWADPKEVAHATHSHVRTVVRWCSAGYVWAVKLASGHGRWRIAVNEYGLPMDPPPRRRA